VPASIGKVSQAQLLADGSQLSIRQDGDGWVIDVPQSAPDPIDTVIVIRGGHP
jgi:hypothetical protein